MIKAPIVKLWAPSRRTRLVLPKMPLVAVVPINELRAKDDRNSCVQRHLGALYS